MMSSHSAPYRPLLEVCVDQVDAILAAMNAGANRIELCSRLDLDGLSPSISAFTEAVYLMDTYLDHKDQLPLQIMVRLSSDSFVYSETEISSMLQYIDSIKFQADSIVAQGALCHDRARVFSGFVFGCLSLQPASSAHPSPFFEVDKDQTERLIAASRPYSVTFHRAFDLVENQIQALETLQNLGVDRILTSGGPGSVEKNMESLKHLLKVSGQLASGSHTSSIIVMPGGGVRAHNAAVLLQLGATELHSSVAFTLSAGQNSIQ